LLYTLNWCTYCHCLHSMWGRVYKTVERPSVRPSVSLSRRSTAGAACSRFATECPVDRRYQSLPGTGTQQQRHRSTVHSNKCGQCHVDSRGTRLNTDLFDTLFIFTMTCCWQLWNAKHAWLTVILLAVICSWHSFSDVHFVTAEGMLLCNFWHESVKIGIPHLHSWHHYSAMDGRISILMGALHWHWPLIELWRTLFQ